MSSSVSGAYDPKEIEEKIYKAWEKSGFFNPDNLKAKKLKAKSYSIVIPPPNITGSLHMGHALNATVQDILIRKKRMEGYKTLWLPGTDHAGIATQNAVEKNLKKKEGKTRHDLGHEKFIEKVWEWKEEYGNTILNQLKKIGSSCDWSRTAFTMDEGYQKKVRDAFMHYHKKGWIYRAERVVNWCPKCQTSLSDLELEYKEEKTKLWYIKYPSTDGKNFITVATTRPETMLGDTAVAINPKDARYKNMVGSTVVLPIVDKEIPIIEDHFVDPEFGTGAVKVTPAHSIIDSEIGERHKLPSVKVIDANGKMIYKKYAGMPIAEAHQKIVDELEKAGLIEKTEDYVHNIALCYRCNSIMENLPSKQWFLKMDELAKMAIKAVTSGKITFHPKKWEKVYLDWLSNIKDWCISRQIWWGHRLPVFYNSKKQEEFPISNFQFPNKSKNPENQKDTSEIYVGDNPPGGYVQVPDVLDTWFSSALWPFATMSDKDLKEFYPTDVLSTARDIINLWVARMIYSGLEFTKKEPFSDVIIHPTILTKKGERMSKSLGTGIDPMKYIEQYGADATRFGLIWQMMGKQDIHWAEEHIIAGKKFLNKIWNASRFVLAQNENYKLQITNSKQIQNLKTQITNEDKKILKELNEIIKSTNENIDNYKFGQALHELYDFFWHDFCDIYLEASKEQMKNEDQKENTAKILIHVLKTSLKLLHPFIPHITEELWTSYKNEGDNLLMVSNWPQVIK